MCDCGLLSRYGSQIVIVNDYDAKKLLLSQGQITVNPPDSAGISKHGWKKVVEGDGGNVY